jgi:hypothetical protein
MKWKLPEVAEKVDRRVVANPGQIRELLTAHTYVGGRDRDRGRRLIAMFACMYFAALRPAEAANLHKDDCELPAAGWGRIYLSRTTPEVGKRHRQRRLHDSKGLKHRPADEVRPVPIPPELVVILHWHLAEFGITPDGRLFRQVNGRVVNSSTYGQVWRAARLIALAPDQQASPRASRVLHFEATVHNTKELRCRRSLENFPEIIIRLAGIAERFATTLDCADISFIADGLLDELPLPAQVGSTGTGGLDLNKPASEPPSRRH